MMDRPATRLEIQVPQPAITHTVTSAVGALGERPRSIPTSEQEGSVKGSSPEPQNRTTVVHTGICGGRLRLALPPVSRAETGETEREQGQ